ncbi:MAG TPA: hypothetical protein VIZ30_04435, partial [Pseudomonadales bacterium]
RVDDELAGAFARLLPQLSDSAEIPTAALLGEIVHSPSSTVLIARDTRDAGRIVGLTSRPSREAANRLYQRLGFALRETNLYRYAPRSGDRYAPRSGDRYAPRADA